MIGLHLLWLQEWRDAPDKLFVLVSEERNLLNCSPVNLLLNLVSVDGLQLLDQVHHLRHVLLDLEPQGLSYFLVELVTNVVFRLNLIENSELFVKDNLLLINGAHEGRERPGGEGEANDSNEHDEYPKDLLSVGARRDVAVPNGGDGSNGVVEGGNVEVNGSQVLEPVAIHPRVLALFEVVDDNPSTGDDVAHEKGHDAEEEESLKVGPNPQQLG